MNLGQNVVAAVKARARTARAPFAHEEIVDGIHLRLEVQDTDRYGVLMRGLSAHVPISPHAPVPGVLAAQAAEVEKRFTYLLENFRLIELDETGGTAQIRSGAPYREADTLHYYEVLLRCGDTLLFARHQQTGKSGERELEPCYLADQVLARVCDDVAAVLSCGA